MKSRLVRRLHVTHEKRNLRKHYTALRFNAGGTADSEDDIRPGIQVCIPGRFFSAPGGARFLRVKVPNPPGSGKDIAEGKGVHREVESEGSRMWEQTNHGQISGLTNRNLI